MCLILRTLELSEKYPDNLALICRREYTDLRDSTIKDFEYYTGMKVGTKKDVLLPNGSTIMFRHGSELNTLQNINLGICGLEQACEFDDDSQWSMLQGRMRRKNVGDPSLFLIANTNGDNWIKRLWKDSPLPGYELYEATTYDNADVLPKSFIDSLEILKLQKPSVYQQYVMNSWDITSGKIFPMWDEEYHVIPDQTLPEWWERFGIIDTAVQSGVFCALQIAVSPSGDLIVEAEYYEKEKLISEHCAGIKERLPMWEKLSLWQFDPSAFNKTREKNRIAYSIADELADYGINGTKAENAVDAGINRVGEYLLVRKEKRHPFKPYLTGSPRLFVMYSCENTRRELPLYREVPNKISERGDRVWTPYKHNDHAVDCLRYAVMSRPIGLEKEPEPEIKIHTAAWFRKKLLEEKESKIHTTPQRYLR